ncbi:thyroid hormone receptor-associated protein 3 isoform X2 [Thalassophryne amazonica]|uniref:thyroid hormone receptor-associated protein 3 isoform X2 n=1 Tax=Thalassophryne amazonica TaxID=390379 RepID=UPI00147181E0|nr:thyroid hormone receptor-associated protein 3 isoform X2 [Thalassophryne amazonica]
MKNHARSRSRSRSRSHSPSHSRENKHPRGYQNNREFRGYHRGFRRPYNFRGRGRGYFPRGRYQRGGGGGYGNNNNFRPNWKNYKQHPKKQQEQNDSRGHFQKRSGSPPFYSHRIDRSASPLSRHSRHSSSSSHSSPPKFKSALLLTNQNSKDAKEDNSASTELQKAAGGADKPVEPLGEPTGDAKESLGSGKPERNWQLLTSCSPNRASTLASSAVIVGRNSQTTNQPTSPTESKNDTSNCALSWQKGCSSSSDKKPSQEVRNPVLCSFDFLNEEYLDGDKAAISIAFRKFLEEQKKKAKSVSENGKNMETTVVNMEEEKTNSKASPSVTDTVSAKCKKDSDCDVSLSSFLKSSPFLSADGEEEKNLPKPHPKYLHKDFCNGDESPKSKSKVNKSAREMFEEGLNKWQNGAYSQVSNDDLEAVADEIHFTRMQEKSAAFAAAFTKRESANTFEELSPERGCNMKKMAQSTSVPSPQTPPRPRRPLDREMFMMKEEEWPVTSPRKQAKFNIRMNFLGDSLISPSEILAQERQLSQDLVQSSKKAQGFRSIFQHVQSAQLQKSPSELFAQHIVTIVHQIKAQHFPASGMTLNDRFTMYQRQAAEKDIMKPRKSPEIHRRIDVSPSAFKKHSQLFEAMKSSEDGTYKDGGEKMKGDPMDLRLDIERRKKYSTHERDYNDNRGKDVGISPNSSKEQAVEEVSKSHKKSKKNKKKRCRSSSSSSSSSSISQKIEHLPHNMSDPKNNTKFNRGRLDQRDSSGPLEKRQTFEGFQIRIHGRDWNRGNYQGNGSNINPANLGVPQKSEDWDPEYTPKSKEYYLHDDRDEDIECNQGRGQGSFILGRPRFIIRRATTSPSCKSRKWVHNKFLVNGMQSDIKKDETEHHKGDIDRDDT